MRIVATIIAMILIPTLLAAECYRNHDMIISGETILFSQWKATSWPRDN